MTTSTLFSALGYAQNEAGPPVPALTVVNTTTPITRASFTLTVSPATGFAEAALSYGPDGVSYPGMQSLYCGPQAGGTTTHALHFHDGAASGGASGADAAQYFRAELLNVSPGATATLTMTY